MQTFLGLAVLALAALALRYRRRRKLRLPPGPSALPVLGSVHHLTLEFQQKQFAELGKQFGVSIFTLCSRLDAVRMLTWHDFLQETSFTSNYSAHRLSS